MDNRKFYELIQSLPTRTQVVGTAANGAAVTTQVHSLFGAVSK